MIITRKELNDLCWLVFEVGRTKTHELYMQTRTSELRKEEFPLVPFASRISRDLTNEILCAEKSKGKPAKVATPPPPPPIKLSNYTYVVYNHIQKWLELYETISDTIPITKRYIPKFIEKKVDCLSHLQPDTNIIVFNVGYDVNYVEFYDSEGAKSDVLTRPQTCLLATNPLCRELIQHKQGDVFSIRIDGALCQYTIIYKEHITQ